MPRRVGGKNTHIAHNHKHALIAYVLVCLQLGIWAVAWLAVASERAKDNPLDSPGVIAAIAILSTSVFFCVAILLKVLCYTYIIADDGKHPN